LAFAVSSTQFPTVKKANTLRFLNYYASSRGHSHLRAGGNQLDVFSEARFTRVLALAANFRAIDDHHWNCAAACHHTVDCQVVFHTHSTCFRTVTDNLVTFAVASLLWVSYGLLDRKPAIYGQHYRSRNEFADGDWNPDECWMDVLRLTMRVQFNGASVSASLRSSRESLSGRRVQSVNSRANIRKVDQGECKV
jgi:hypothetical protein